METKDQMFKSKMQIAQDKQKRIKEMQDKNLDEVLREIERKQEEDLSALTNEVGRIRNRD